MKADIVSVYKVVKESDIPNGEYIGLWSGGVITFDVKNNKFRLNVSNGIRGTVNCIIKVSSREIDVEVP